MPRIDWKSRISGLTQTSGGGKMGDYIGRLWMKTDVTFVEQWGCFENS